MIVLLEDQRTNKHNEKFVIIVYWINVKYYDQNMYFRAREFISSVRVFSWDKYSISFIPRDGALVQVQVDLL